jgi:hypothetical protein
MTPEIGHCFLDQDVREAARLMQEKQVHRLLVFDHPKHLVGVISLGGLAMGGGDDQLSGETLERASEISGPHR